MLQKGSNHLSFLSTRSYNSRPLSEATEIYDTDFEADFSPDDNSPRRSVDSFGNDSSTTLSTPDDLPTPSDHVAFNFQFSESESVKGPSGPHLFRRSLDTPPLVQPDEAEQYLTLSPMAPEQVMTTTIRTRELPRQSRRMPERSQSLDAVHQPPRVDETQVRLWSPAQVAQWLYDADFEEVIVRQFLQNDISGSVLLDLQIDDLRELQIQSFGKRHRLMSLIENLRGSLPSSPEDNPIQRSFSSREKTKAKPRQRSGSKDCTSESEPLTRGSSRRRGRQNRVLMENDVISPAESVSIVAIEQLLPTPHKCSRGEDCPKYRKQQRKLARIAKNFPNEYIQTGRALIAGDPGNPATAENMLRPKSDAEPSVAASSDVLGPGQLPPFELNAQNLNVVKPRDPQESVRQFLNFQHMNSPGFPDNRPLEMFPPLTPPESSHQPAGVASHLRSLPRLMIPNDPAEDELISPQGTITPLNGATATQERNPYGYGQMDMYRQTTPFSEMDVPITAYPIDPLERQISQSVPPEMLCGDRQYSSQDPITRSASSRPDHRRRPSFPTMARLDEVEVPPAPQHHASSSQSSIGTGSCSRQTTRTDSDITHAGWMKKRKTTRLLRHEWQDAHFTLKGTVLAMHKDERDALHTAKALESIDVDDYAVACSSLATNSKLTAAFKRSVLRKAANLSTNGISLGADETAFAFSLVPTAAERKALFTATGKSHHFAVKTRDERINWMRELMLAKALKRGKEGGGEVTVNGNVI